jgi:hypothetical protein
MRLNRVKVAWQLPFVFPTEKEKKGFVFSRKFPLGELSTTGQRTTTGKYLLSGLFNYRNGPESLGGVR